MRSLGDWIVDFENQVAYRGMHGVADLFECRDFRTRDAEPSVLEFAELPAQVQIYLRPSTRI